MKQSEWVLLEGKGKEKKYQRDYLHQLGAKEFVNIIWSGD
jgi:hypothetical protein